jgi:hypothetical protein
MHPFDIPMAESGGPFRPMRAAPGLLRRVLCKLLYHSDQRLGPVAINQPLRVSAKLPVFLSKLPDSATAGLSPTMCRRVSAISGARNRLSEIYANEDSEAVANMLKLQVMRPESRKRWSPELTVGRRETVF